MDEGLAMVVASMIAAVASIGAAWLASRADRSSKVVERRMKLRQIRLDERDLIGAESGFLMPIENDAMWRDYYRERTINNKSRLDASQAVRPQIANSTDDRVAQPLND